MKYEKHAVVTVLFTLAVLVLIGCAETPTGVTHPDEEGVRVEYLKANQEMFSLAKGLGFSLLDIAVVEPDRETTLEVFGGKVVLPAGAVNEPTLFVFYPGIEDGCLVFVVNIPGHPGHFTLQKPATLEVDRRFLYEKPDFAENMETGERYHDIREGGLFYKCYGVEGFTKYRWAILD